METTTLVNGQTSPLVEACDRGLAYGDGVFETIALVQGQVQLWHAHKQRLMSGLLTLGIVADEACAVALVDIIALELKTAYELFNHSEGVIKITVTRGSGGRGYAAPTFAVPTRIVSFMPWPSGRQHLSSEGVCVRMCKHRWSHNAALAGIKHLNRLDQVMARSEWTDLAIHEGIVLNQEGWVISGAMSNLFIEIGGQLITPKLDLCGIKGTMAEHIAGIAVQSGITLIHQNVSIEAMVKADSVFLTNSINGIWPVVELLPNGACETNTHRVWPISELVKQLQQSLAKDLAQQPLVSGVC